jgi:preprotein translocase subunit SecE
MAGQGSIAQGNMMLRAKKFLKEVRSELRKVTWPNRKELLSYTIIVFVTVVVVASLIWVLDIAFNQIMQLIF